LLNSTDAVIKSLQFTILILAIAIPLHIIVYLEAKQLATGLFQRIIFDIMLFVPPIFMLFITVPNIIPRLVICTSVAAMTRKKILRDTVKKIDKNIKNHLTSDGKPNVPEVVHVSPADFNNVSHAPHKVW